MTICRYADSDRALAEPVLGNLERMRALRSDPVSFDPAAAERTFSFFIIDAGVAQMLPPIIYHLAGAVGMPCRNAGGTSVKVSTVVV